MGMRRAVFSFVMEQMSFSRTVSCAPTTKNMQFPHGGGTSCQSAVIGTYQRFPAEDVAIETDPVLREVESSLQQDVPLESTGVVWRRRRRRKEKKERWRENNITLCFHSEDFHIITK